MAWYDNMNLDPRRLFGLMGGDPAASINAANLSPNDMQAGQPGPMATQVRWPTPRSGMVGLDRRGYPNQYGGGGNIPGIASRYGFSPASAPMVQPQGQDLSGMTWNEVPPGGSPPLSGQEQPTTGPLNVDTNWGVGQSPSSDYAVNSFTTDRTPTQTPQQPEQPTIFGMSPDRFSLLAGAAAHAISPYTWGGRLGGQMAEIAAQDLRGQQYQQGMRERMAGGGRGTGGRTGYIPPGYSWQEDPSNPNSPIHTAPGAPLWNVPKDATAISRNAQPGDQPIYISPRALNPNQTLVGPSTELPYQAPPGPLNPSQTLPPANRDPNVTFTAPPKPFSPRESAVGPGYSLPTAEGGWNRAPLSPAQEAGAVKNLAPGASPYNTQTERLGPQAPIVPSQGARPQVNRATAGDKPTTFTQQVETFAQQFSALQPTAATSFGLAHPFGGQSSVPPQQQALDMIRRERNPSRKSAMEKAYQQVLPSWGLSQSSPETTPMGVHRLSGQRTERADGTYQLPNGSRVTVTNGVIQ